MMAMSKTKVNGRQREARVLDDEDEMVGHIRRAWQQIDAEAGGALGWLTGFVREDPSRWLPGEQEAHGYRLLALVYGRLPENLRRHGHGNIPPIKPALVKGSHAELRAFLHELVRIPAGVLLPVPTEGLAESLFRATPPGEKRAIFGTSRSGLRRTLLFQAVKGLILEKGDRLTACPGPACGEPFLALRKKKFCSSTCLQRWWDAKRPKKRGAR
jgi:hypothetical protein